MNFFYSIIIILLLFLFIPLIIIYIKFDKKFIKSYFKIKKNKKLFPYIDNGIGHGIAYNPHPLTNWSLNPNYIDKYQNIPHTIEGFRKTCENESIFNKNFYETKKKIICIGGSSTYCTDIFNNEQTWPFLLNNVALKNNNYVINFGIPHFNTSLAFIRFVSWFNRIKPNLIILMLAKNDLNLLTNISDKEEYSFPDFQNIMNSFNFDYIFKNKYQYFGFLSDYINLKTLSRIDFNILYNTEPKIDRISNKINKIFIDDMIFRTLNIINFANQNNTKVIYIPEICSNNGIMRDTLYNKFYNKLIPEINNYKNCQLLDLRELIPNNESYFIDTVHLNKNGCKLFSELVSNYIFKDNINNV